MVRRFAEAVAAHPVRALLVIGAITLVFLFFAPRIQFLSEMDKMLPAGDPVVAKFRETKDTFGSQSVLMVGVAAPEGGTLFTLESVRKLYSLTQELESLVDEGLLEEVVSPTNVDIVEGTELALVVRPALRRPPADEAEARAFVDRLLAERRIAGSLVLEDGSACLIVLKVHPEAEGNKEKVAELVSRVEGILARYRGPEEFYLTGDAAFVHYMDAYMRQDLRVLFPIVVLVVLGVLFLSFRVLRGMFLPLAVVIVAVIWTVGLMSLVGVKLSMVSSFLPVLLVAVGSAYGIHVVNHYFERAGEGSPKRELIAEVVEAMANPVFASALTTAAGFLTLISAFLKPIREFAIFSAVGVLISFAVALTLIPAVLSLLPLPRGRVAHRSRARAAGALARGVYRRGPWLLLGAGVIFAVFLSQIPHIQVESDMAKYFRPEAPVIQGLRFIERNFGGSQNISIVIETGRRDGLKDPEVLAFVDALQRHLETSGIVGYTSSIVDLIKETNYTLHGDDEDYYAIPDSPRAVAQLLLLYEMGGGKILRSMVTRDFSAAQLTARVRSVGTAAYEALMADVGRFIAEHAPPGVTGYVTGSLVIYVRISHKIVQSQIVSLFASFGAVWLIVSLLLGTAVGGAFALLPLVVSVVGNFGVMAVTGARLDMATVMIASLVIGIGVDYAVHFITRYRRERMRGLPHPEALHVTYDTAGRAILYNALTLTAGFLVLLLSRFGALATMGWLTALTMVTSSAGALLVLPAVLGLVEPRFLNRRYVLRWTKGGPRLAKLVADPRGGKTERRES
ncbi:MAG: RND family transporter [Caldiserica bacterium]|nr:RND family transporter [Caldisericota bacterium]